MKPEEEGLLRRVKEERDALLAMVKRLADAVADVYYSEFNDGRESVPDAVAADALIEKIEKGLKL